MAKIDLEYAQMLSKIVLNGKIFVNEEGVVRRQIPYYTFRHEMCNGFPATTIRKIDIEEKLFYIIDIFKTNKEVFSKMVAEIKDKKNGLNNLISDLCYFVADYNDAGEFMYEYHFRKLFYSLLHIQDNLFVGGMFALIMESLIGIKTSAIQFDLKALYTLEAGIDETRDLLTKNPMLHDACQVSVPIYLSSENESVEWKLDRLKVEDFTITNYPNFKD